MQAQRVQADMQVRPTILRIRSMFRKSLRRLMLRFSSLLFNRLDSDSLFSRGIANLLLHLFLTTKNKEKYSNSYNRNRTFDHNALWSFPKSGNHWLRFISEYLTGCPTCGCITNLTDIPIYLNTFPSEKHPLSHVNPRDPFVLYKSHWAYKITHGSAILLIIRDYHEAISWLVGVKEFVGRTFMYLELIAAYNRFDGNKMIIYYEDLLAYPEREISRLRYFLNASDKLYKTFMDDHDYYAELSKQGENRCWHGYNSAGYLKFYQKKLSKQDLLTRKNVFQAFLATKQFQCVKPYLARYE